MPNEIYRQPTTIGRLMIEQALGEDVAFDELNKKNLNKILLGIALQKPEKYKDTVKKLVQLGAEIITRSGYSFSIDDLKPSPDLIRSRQEFAKKAFQTYKQYAKDPKKRKEEMVKLLSDYANKVTDQLYQKGLRQGNSFAYQIYSGARGKPNQLRAMVFAPVILTDSNNEPIPIPVLSSYSEGLSPFDYYIASFGTRKGYVDVKQATRDAGYLSKQFAQAVSDLVVTKENPKDNEGLPVDIDKEIIGRYLARPVAGLPAGTLIDKDAYEKIVKSKAKKIYIYSPLTDKSTHGLSSKSVGLLQGRKPQIGENLGILLATSISEPITQTQISSKHKAGLLQKGVQIGSYDVIKSFLTAPENFSLMATVAKTDGIVLNIEKAPQGGNIITIGEEKHYVPPNLGVTVKKGQKVEAGDVLSEGVANPAEITKYKGIGEGRRYFMEKFKEILDAADIDVRRNALETIARGLVRHVKITHPDGYKGWLPDDIVEYETLASKWEPRADSKLMSPKMAINHYLEKPVLHLTIGTRITPKLVKILEEAKIDKILVNESAPPFEPIFIRPLMALAQKENWMSRLAGFGLKKSLLEAVHRGRTAQRHGISPYPALAEAVEFGKGLKGPY